MDGGLGKFGLTAVAPANSTPTELHSIATPSKAGDDAAKLLSPHNPLLIFGVLAAATFGFMAVGTNVKVGPVSGSLHLGKCPGVADTDDTTTPPAGNTPPAGPTPPTNEKGPDVAASTTTEITPGQAVRFRYTDPLFGNTIDRSGIVINVADDVVTVAPVEPYAVPVPAGDVEPLTAAA